MATIKFAKVIYKPNAGKQLNVAYGLLVDCVLLYNALGTRRGLVCRGIRDSVSRPLAPTGYTSQSPVLAPFTNYQNHN